MIISCVGVLYLLSNDALGIIISDTLVSGSVVVNYIGSRIRCYLSETVLLCNIISDNETTEQIHTSCIDQITEIIITSEMPTANEPGFVRYHDHNNYVL